MQNLLRGLHHFRSGVFENQKELFTQLVQGQNPSVLFISCSDSRVVPALMMQTGPGRLCSNCATPATSCPRTVRVTEENRRPSSLPWPAWMCATSWSAAIRTAAR